MADRTPPHDLAAEDGIIGAMLLAPHVIDEVQRTVTAGDFYRPRNQTLFYEILGLWKQGSKIDAVILAERLETHGQLQQIGGAAEIISLVANCPTSSLAPRYAEIIANKSMLRRAIGIGTELALRSYDNPDDPQALMQEAIGALQEANVSIGEMPDAVWELDSYLDQPPEASPDWIIPDVIRQGWRVMLVASEGSGKTTLFRQVAICTAQGIHAFLHTPIPPKRTLIVDCENPQDSIVDMCIPIRDAARAQRGTEYDSDRAWLWWQPQGINLRSRSDRMKLESVIQHVKPDLVAIGPVYKIYQVNAHENDELAAREVMTTLDDLRTRYRFGLMMEHHAPKGTGAKREMMPFGTSLWLRWPELGISMQPLTENDVSHMQVGRWRGDRLKNNWPKELRHSTPWPWEGIYETDASRVPPRQTWHDNTRDRYDNERESVEEEPDTPTTGEQITMLTDIVEGGIVKGYGPNDMPF